MSIYRSHISTGFSLLELLTVLCISALLMHLVVPGYSQLLYRARRSDAVSSLLALQLALERYRLQCAGYPSQLTATPQCDDNDPSQSRSLSQPYSSQAYYRLELTTSLTGPNASESYRLVATANGVQAGDHHCLHFYLDQDGQQSASDAEGRPQYDCW